MLLPPIAIKLKGLPQPSMSAPDPAILKVAERALDFVPEGATIGLGSGRASMAFIQALGARVKAGFKTRGVPTSEASAELARRLGIPLTTLDACPRLAVDFDGADEVDPRGNLIKGYGGALVREKIVAAASEKLVILVGAEKIVSQLGQRGNIPVEVIPLGLTPCKLALQRVGLEPRLRETDGKPLITDNGNYILDCGTGPIGNPQSLELALRAIPGVVGSGLFLNMQPTVIIGHADQVEVRGE
jgi:ribose 5-phosphate isomerase A